MQIKNYITNRTSEHKNKRMDQVFALGKGQYVISLLSLLYSLTENLCNDLLMQPTSIEDGNVISHYIIYTSLFNCICQTGLSSITSIYTHYKIMIVTVLYEYIYIIPGATVINRTSKKMRWNLNSTKSKEI